MSGVTLQEEYHATFTINNTHYRVRRLYCRTHQSLGVDTPANVSGDSQPYIRKPQKLFVAITLQRPFSDTHRRINWNSPQTGLDIPHLLLFSSF